jgi:ElaA protein
MKPDAVNWEVRSFAELDTDLLYEIMRQRQQVFVLEQNCVYQDLDGLDRDCFHLYCQREGELLAYMRCLPPGLSYTESSLGRILVAASARGLKLGRELVERGVAFNHSTWPHCAIKIGAQTYLENFYRSLGFQIVGEPYDEDGIAHQKMRLEAI